MTGLHLMRFTIGMHAVDKTRIEIVIEYIICLSYKKFMVTVIIQQPRFEVILRTDAFINFLL